MARADHVVLALDHLPDVVDDGVDDRSGAVARGDRLFGGHAGPQRTRGQRTARPAGGGTAGCGRGGATGGPRRRHRRHEAGGRSGRRRGCAAGPAPRCRRPATATPRTGSTPWPGWSARCAVGDEAALRGGLWRADDPGRRVGVAPERAAGAAGFPLRSRLAGTDRPADRRRQRRQGAGRSARAGSAPPPASATSSPWWCRPASAAASCSTAACSTVPPGNAGHIGHIIVEPGGPAVRVRRPGVPRGRGVGHRDRGGHRAAGRRGRSGAPAADRHDGRAGGGVGGQPARPAPGGGRGLGGARVRRGRSSRPPRQEVDARARLDFSAGTRIVPAGLGDAGPLVGAAALAWRQTG